MTDCWRDEYKCPICGKEFYTTPLHVYKDSSGKKLCSWSCLCKYRKQYEAEIQDRRDKNIRKFKINGEYLTVKQIAEKAGLSKSTINSRIRLGMKGEALLSPRAITRRKKGE